MKSTVVETWYSYHALCSYQAQVHIQIMNALYKIVCLQVNLVILSKFS